MKKKNPIKPACYYCSCFAVQTAREHLRKVYRLNRNNAYYIIEPAVPVHQLQAPVYLNI